MKIYRKEIENLKIAQKASGQWILEVLGAPYGGQVNGKDAQGEYFSERTDFMLEIGDERPAIYYHGDSPSGNKENRPEVIGKALAIRRDNRGLWFEVVLKKTSKYARRIWEAVLNGKAKASSGAIAHLVRKTLDGELLTWPIGELSLLDVGQARQPANQLAVVNLKALFDLAEIEMPNFGDEMSTFDEKNIEAMVDSYFTRKDEIEAAREEGKREGFAERAKELKAKPAKTEQDKFLDGIRYKLRDAFIKLNEYTDPVPVESPRIRCWVKGVPGQPTSENSKKWISYDPPYRLRAQLSPKRRAARRELYAEMMAEKDPKKAKILKDKIYQIAIHQQFSGIHETAEAQVRWGLAWMQLCDEFLEWFEQDLQSETPLPNWIVESIRKRHEFEKHIDEYVHGKPLIPEKPELFAVDLEAPEMRVNEMPVGLLETGERVIFKSWEEANREHTHEVIEGQDGLPIIIFHPKNKDIYWEEENAPSE